MKRLQEEMFGKQGENEAGKLAEGTTETVAEGSKDPENTK